MKKAGIIISLFIVGILFLIIGISSTNASNDIVNFKFKRVKSLYVPASYTNTSYGVYNSVQSFVHTKENYIFMLTNTILDSESKPNTNLLYIMCKKDNKWQHCKSINKLSYGHGNDMVYNTYDNTIAIVFTDYKTQKGTVAFLDGTTFKEKSRITVKYKYTSIAYDPTIKRYYLGRGNSEKRKFYYTVCEGKISESTCTYDAFSSDRNMTGQGAGAYGGYFYKINFEANKATQYQEQSFLGYKGGEIDVYDKNYNHIRKIYFKSSQLGTDIGEIEGVDLNGNTPYFIFNGNTIKNSSIDGYNTLARIYIPDYTPRNINAKIVTKVSTNNKKGFEKLKFNTKYTSSTPSTNKDVAYSNGLYSLNNINIKQEGKYTFDAKQVNQSKTNWKFDTSTKKATINVKYSLSINNLIYTTSFNKGDNTFSNVYTYPTISVPLSVSITTSKQSNELPTPTTKASLYNGTKKLETVTATNGKYSFKTLKINKKGTYKYIIKQESSGTSRNGVFVNNIDSSEINVTITATEGEKNIEYTAKYSKNSFKNTVKAEYNEVENDISIKIKTTKSDEYTPIPETTAILTKNNKTVDSTTSSSNKYQFKIKIKSPGTYKYIIKQDTSISGQGIYAYNLDKSDITVTIKATIDNNQLVCEKSISKNTFTNKIVTNYNEINIPISIKINTNKSSESIPIPETTAVLTTGGKKHTLNSDTGYYNYTAKVKKPGTYKYVIEQDNLDNTDEYIYDIDNTVITYTAVVTSEDGTLKYTIITESDSFTNAISPNDNVLDLTISVHIKTELSNDAKTPQTTAELYYNGDKIKEANSERKRYAFQNIRITEEGVYTYTIKQTVTGTVIDGHHQYQFDDSTITVTITVTTENERLKARTYYSNNNFVNTSTIVYDEISVPINININNDKDEPSIVIPETTASIYEDENKIATVNNSNDKYNFNIPMNAPGEHVYEIKQDNSGIAKKDDFNYYLDTDKKTCTVKVTSVNEELDYTVNCLYNDKSFENTYVKKYDAISVPIDVDIITDKPKESIANPSTTAVLIEDDEEIEIASSDNNKYHFESLEFLTAGTFVYEIKQKNSGTITNGIYEYIIDEESIIVEIEVKVENSKLTYQILTENTSFNNQIITHYNPINIPISIDITDSNDRLEYSSSAIISDDNKVIESLEKNNHRYESNNITVSEEGIYTYKIRQKKPLVFKKSGIKKELDDNVITATVKVEAVNDSLNYRINYDRNSFNNTISSTEESDDESVKVPINIDIYSNSPNINNLDIQATLYEDNLPLETSSNNNSEYQFSELNLPKGTYSYQIKQINPGADEWNIDEETLDLDITVNDDLTYTVQFRNDVSSFTNIDLKTVDTTPEEQTEAYETVTGIPNTGINSNNIFKLLGLLLMTLGVIIFYKNIYNKEIS